MGTGARELLVCFYSLCYVLEVENETGDPGTGRGVRLEAWSRRSKEGQTRKAKVLLKSESSDWQGQQRIVALKKLGVVVEEERRRGRLNIKGGLVPLPKEAMTGGPTTVKPLLKQIWPAAMLALHHQSLRANDLPPRGPSDPF